MQQTDLKEKGKEQERKGKEKEKRKKRKEKKKKRKGKERKGKKPPLPPGAENEGLNLLLWYCVAGVG